MAVKQKFEPMIEMKQIMRDIDKIYKNIQLCTIDINEHGIKCRWKIFNGDYFFTEFFLEEIQKQKLNTFRIYAADIIKEGAIQKLLEVTCYEFK